MTVRAHTSTRSTHNPWRCTTRLRGVGYFQSFCVCAAGTFHKLSSLPFSFFSETRHLFGGIVIISTATQQYHCGAYATVVYATLTNIISVLISIYIVHVSLITEQRRAETCHSRAPFGVRQGISVLEHSAAHGLHGQATIEKLPYAAAPRASCPRESQATPRSRRNSLPEQ